MHIVIHTDGGSRGNPGPAAAGFTIHTAQEELIHEESSYLGHSTNNVAEYTALRMAVEWITLNHKKMGIESVDILMDSELVVKQMKGEYKIKSEDLMSIASHIKQLQRELPFPLQFIHVRRAQNAHADKLVNAAMDAEISK